MAHKGKVILNPHQQTKKPLKLKLECEFSIMDVAILLEQTLHRTCLSNAWGFGVFTYAHVIYDNQLSSLRLFQNFVQHGIGTFDFCLRREYHMHIKSTFP